MVSPDAARPIRSDRAAGGIFVWGYLRAGAIARFAPVVQALPEYIEKQRGIVLGICNGFQILTEAGLLPGALTKNLTPQFPPHPFPLRKRRG
jgi:phosphoribosylformylglycinamidine (FGAM) synthase-like amidotransferase family enzyme